MLALTFMYAIVPALSDHPGQFILPFVARKVELLLGFVARSRQSASFLTKIMLETGKLWQNCHFIPT